MQKLRTCPLEAHMLRDLVSLADQALLLGLFLLVMSGLGVSVPL